MMINLALIGNQNCGKTTLFNSLCGMHRHVGNFPGVTVEQSYGVPVSFPQARIIDLPGIYSLHPYSEEERLTCRFLLEQPPQAIINIVDAGNLTRNLYLTMQLLTLDIPMVLALNMMDEVQKQGITIDTALLSERLGIPVVPISAANHDHVDTLLQKAVFVAQNNLHPHPTPNTDFPAVHRCIQTVSAVLQPHLPPNTTTWRFWTECVIEREIPLISEVIPPTKKEERAPKPFVLFSQPDKKETDIISRAITELEQRCGTDSRVIMADMRYQMITQLCSRALQGKPEPYMTPPQRTLDDFFTHPLLALPLFFCVMWFIFCCTFQWIGPFFSQLVSYDLEKLGILLQHGLEEIHVSAWIQNFICKGILGGVGSVISFLPIILTLFFLLSLLEDSGYLARIAFVMDTPLRRIGLSGRCLVPMLIGLGCTVPAVMATRTLSSNKEKTKAILLTPYISCSAKIPIFTMCIAAFFPRHRVILLLFLYLFGLIVGLLVCALFSRISGKHWADSFILELPPYRLPKIKNVLLLLWEKAREFLYRAFTLIFLFSVFLWLLQTFDLYARPTSDQSQSLLAAMGRSLTPLFAPLGLHDWRIPTALFAGFGAKEAVVGTLCLLTGTTAQTAAPALYHLFPSVPSLFSFLTFVLLYPPCIAATATIRREWHVRAAALRIIVLQCIVAWISAFLVYHVSSLFF